MRRGDVAAAGALLAAFAALLAGAAALPYGTEFAPGAGFAPLWYGLAGLALSGYVLVTALRAPPPPGPEAAGVRRVVVAIAGLALALAAMPALGFLTAILAYLLLVTLTIERLRPRVALATTAGIGLLVYVVFARVLGVPFPIGPLGF